MADDWDLYAVVRSCTISVATSTASSAVTAATATISSLENSNKEQGDSFLRSSSFLSDDNQFQIPGSIDDKDESFQGLEEIYKELHSEIFYSQHRPKPCINPVPGELQNQQLPQQQTHENIQPQQVIQRQQSLQLRNSVLGPSLSFPSTSPQPIRPRRRKSHQAKMIHQMTQEELSGDSWAWRKYGQKPIKGSPYPRNYYRCSTSKGCTARKQVERCPTDPNIFVVSYSGEHSHPRPTHRSSLAGSTRSKFSPAAKSNSSDPLNAAPNSSMAAPMASCSSSPPASASSFSPTTRESEAEENNSDSGPNMENDKEEMRLDIEKEDGNDDEDILIPNSFMTDDIFRGFQDLSGGT